jgi:hypothetical protein
MRLMPRMPAPLPSALLRAVNPAAPPPLRALAWGVWASTAEFERPIDVIQFAAPVYYRPSEEVRVIEGVEAFHPELERPSFFEGESFQERQVEVQLSGSAK